MCCSYIADPQRKYRSLQLKHLFHCPGTSTALKGLAVDFKIPCPSLLVTDHA